MLTPEDDVNRRKFVSLVLAGGSSATFAALETVRSGLASALGNRETSVPSVDEWQEMTRTYGRSYLAHTPEAFIVDLAVDLADLHTQIREETNDSRKRELFQVGS